MIETGIVAVVVAAAAFQLIRLVWPKRAGCGTNCACACASKPGLRAPSNPGAEA
jgi:hypothetical protein